MRPTQTRGNSGGGGGVTRIDGLELVDPDLERAFLCAAVHHPELILNSEIVEHDFYGTPHRLIFTALLNLVAEGEPVNTLALEAHLKQRGHIGAVGGRDYLLDLTDSLPMRDGPWRKIRLLAKKRRVQSAAAMVQAKMGTDECSRYIAQFQAAVLDLESLERNERQIPLLADLVPGIEQTGPRLSTNLKTLDEALRGGIPMGRFIALLGAPGASKTNLAAWLADKWERAGCAVCYVAADEARNSIITRFGQLAGFDRDGLEGEDPGRRNAFARAVAPRALMVIDPSADECSLEEAERQLIDFARGKPRVMIVDSLQTVMCEMAEDAETSRERVESVVHVIKGMCMRGTTVIGISEMSRSGYRTGKRDQDVGALSAAAESRKVEYDAHLLLGLKPVKGEKGVVDVETGKNRIGTDKPDLRIRVDFDSLQFTETERPADELAEADNKRTSELRTRVLALLAKEPATHKTRGSIQRAVGARKSTLCEVMRELVEDGSIDKVGGYFRPALGGSF